MKRFGFLFSAIALLSGSAMAAPTGFPASITIDVSGSGAFQGQVELDYTNNIFNNIPGYLASDPEGDVLTITDQTNSNAAPEQWKLSDSFALTGNDSTIHNESGGVDIQATVSFSPQGSPSISGFDAHYDDSGETADEYSGATVSAVPEAGCVAGGLLTGILSLARRPRRNTAEM